MARFLGMARDYGRSIGFESSFKIEPQPMKPMYHQYDTTILAAVLERSGLLIADPG